MTNLTIFLVLYIVHFWRFCPLQVLNESRDDQGDGKHTLPVTSEETVFHFMHNVRDLFECPYQFLCLTGLIDSTSICEPDFSHDLNI